MISALLFRAIPNNYLVNGFLLHPKCYGGGSGGARRAPLFGKLCSLHLLRGGHKSESTRHDILSRLSARTSQEGCKEDHDNTACRYTTTPEQPSEPSAPQSSALQEASAAVTLSSRLTLLFVAFLYGTLNVALRLIYAQPDPPTPSVLSVTRGWIAALSFVPILVLSNRGRNRTRGQVEGGRVNLNDSSSFSNSSESSSTSPSLWKVAIELALWNFGAQGLLNIGLTMVDSAARAAFLTQTSVIITPVLSSMFFGQYISSKIWYSCVLALVGLVLLFIGGGSEDAAGSVGFLNLPSFSFTPGDCIILGGALCWSMYLFRASNIANNMGSNSDAASTSSNIATTNIAYSPAVGVSQQQSELRDFDLQAMKTMFVAIFYTGWLAASIALVLKANTTGGTSTVPTIAMIQSALIKLWPGWNNTKSTFSWLLLAYSAIGPGAIADVLQQRGQRYIAASETNVILSCEPVFTALCARVVLVNEITTPLENVGGLLIILAAFLSSSSSHKIKQ